MPRSSRYAPGGMIFHVLNRGVGRRAVFEKDGNYFAFEKVMDETLRTARCGFVPTVCCRTLALRALAGARR